MSSEPRTIEPISGEKPHILDTQAIMGLIPHRYPFLLIDKVIDVAGDERATGIKCVSVSEPFFQGHFPDQPIMPGVLIVEAMAQTAGAIVVNNLPNNDGQPGVYFMSIENTRFRRPVVPGDTLYLHVKKIRQRGKVWKYSSEAMVNGQLVAEAAFTAMIVDGR